MKKFWKQRQDIPLDRDVTGRALPWILSVMAFVAVLSLSGAVSLQQMMARWQSGLEGTASLQVLPLGEGTDEAARLSSIMSALNSSPLVEKATVVSDEAMQQLLSPWLGEGALPSDLPMPTLIDIRLKPEVKDLVPLRVSLSNFPNTTLDAHGDSLKEVRQLVWLVLGIAYGIVALIGVSSGLIIWLLVRTGLAVHHDTVELLHLVGATDRYVARQFQRHVAGLAAQGFILGTLAALGTLALLRHYGGGFNLGLPLMVMDERMVAYSALAVPLAGVLLAYMTARQSALSLLHRMP